MFSKLTWQLLNNLQDYRIFINTYLKQKYEYRIKIYCKIY